MATDIAQLSTYTDATREAHRDKWAKSVNTDLWLFNHIKGDKQPHNGEELVNFTLQTGLAESATFTAAGAAHPAAVQSTFDKGQLYIKKLLSIMKYNEEILHLTGKEAIVKRLVSLRMDTTDAYNILKEFSLYTPGNGILATATSVDSGQTFTVDSVRWLRKNMVLDGYDASNNHDADSIVITDINPSTLTVTVTGTITSVDTNTNFYYNDTWLTSGSRTISATKFTNGIETICSDVDPAYGNFEGLDRDSYEYAKAVVKYGASAGTNEAFTQDRLFDLLDLGQTQVGLKNLPKEAICDPKCFRAIYNSFRDEHQPTVFMPAKDGMPEGLQFQYGSHTIRIVSAHRAAPNKLLLPNLNHIIKYSGGPEGWDTTSGVRWIASYQQFEEIFRGWWNYGTDFPQSNMALFDITGA